MPPFLRSARVGAWPLLVAPLVVFVFDRCASAQESQQTLVLPTIDIIAPPSEATPSFSAPQKPPEKQKYQLPQTSASITQEKISKTINAVDPEDAVKYFPSLFVRKRNYGDTQAVLATRTWGVNSSARSLIYADDFLLSTLIANNNTIGGPRWGLVSPDMIQRMDFLYGPYAAAYPGNSMGGVLQITTRMPDKPFATVGQVGALQTFGLYGTKADYGTSSTTFGAGNRINNLSWLITGSFQDSASQPLGFVTNGSIPKGTTGAFYALNKTGQAADVVGAGGLLRSEMGNVNGKFAYDINPWLKATYQIGLFLNSTDSTVQTYMNGANGLPTFGGVSGFANNRYTLDETHLANAVSLVTDTKGAFDWDVSVSNYYFLNDIQRNPFGVLPTGEAFTPYGKITRMDGTNWTNADLKGIWRPQGFGGPHEVSFGVHADHEYLNNPVYGTPDWQGGPDSTSTLYTDSVGATTTEAIWAQDAWRFAPQWKLTPGGRLEFWQATDGYNLATTTNSSTGAITNTLAQSQPRETAVRFSPKLSLDWTPSPQWEVTGSVGQAYRFPTVTELYQIVSSGPVLAIPNPDLKPENDLSAELAVQRKFPDGDIRLSLFNDYVRDALISQTNTVTAPATGSQIPVTTISNVDAIRLTGAELAAAKDNVAIDGLSLFGSVTYVNSRILSDPAWAGVTTVVGKRVPYVPDWRATLGFIYHPTDRWSFTAAARYSGKQYSTLDNTDTVSHVFGAFDRFLVIDMRAQYKYNDHATISFGIDNLTNAQYYLYHPFPQRTFVLEAKATF